MECVVDETAPSGPGKLTRVELGPQEVLPLGARRMDATKRVNTPCTAMLECLEVGLMEPDRLEGS